MIRLSVQLLLKVSRMSNPYSNHQWRKLRKQVLAEQPLCVMCQKVGVITAADTVDHIVPHKGDVNLFWSRDNLQALCSSHHSSQKQSEERGGSGHDTACDMNGDPVDVDHPWNAKS